MSSLSKISQVRHQLHIVDNLNHAISAKAQEIVNNTVRIAPFQSMVLSLILLTVNNYYEGRQGQHFTADLQVLLFVSDLRFNITSRVLH